MGLDSAQCRLAKKRRGFRLAPQIHEGHETAYGTVTEFNRALAGY